MTINKKYGKELIPKDHSGLYLKAPFNPGIQVKFPGEKATLEKHLWNLWSLSGGKIGKKPPKKVMEEWQ